MADNYLEKQMDDYRSGRLGQRSTVRSPQHKSPLRFTPADILITDGALTDGALAMIDALKSAGCSVSFTGSDAAAARRTASLTGAMYIPPEMLTPDTLRRLRPKGFDYQLSIADTMLGIKPLNEDGDIRTISFTPQSASPSALAQALLFALSPGLKQLDIRL